MKSNPEMEWDDFLRRELRADPAPTPIVNLTERAIALAESRPMLVQNVQSDRYQPTTDRLARVATFVAAAAVIGVLVIGGWHLVQAMSSTGTEALNASSYLYSGNSYSHGFAVLLLAAVVIVFGWLMRSILDSMETELTPW